MLDQAPRGSTLTLLALVAVTAVASPAWAQGSRAGIVTASQGQITAARSGLPARVPLKFKDDVFLRDRIELRLQEHLHHVHRQQLAVLRGEHLRLGERVL